eukprot:1752314-Prymnesium_polylepis.1
MRMRAAATGQPIRECLSRAPCHTAHAASTPSAQRPSAAAAAGGGVGVGVAIAIAACLGNRRPRCLILLCPGPLAGP